MKKFTTLEEDLLKENAQVQEKFDAEMNQALENLDKIQKALISHKEEYLTNAGNWGFVGSLEHVNELLNETLDFLNDKEDNQEDEHEPFTIRRQREIVKNIKGK